MDQRSILLRLCCKVLTLAMLTGLTIDFVVSKTVTHHPGPCTKPGCDHSNHNLNQEEEPVLSGSDRLNIDPDSLLHPAGSSHVHDEAPPGDAEAQDVGADAPDVRKELHGGVAEEHPNTGEEPNLEETGPDMEAALHGGMKHVHSPEATEDLSRSIEHDGVFEVNPEEMLHGGQDAHKHGESDQEDRQNSEGNFDLGTDIEALLHGGDHLAHSPDKRREPRSDDIPEVPIGASDPEALLHDGNGHVHGHGGAAERNDPDPRPFGAADPEELLHGGGSDDKHVHTVRQAMDGSRPLSGAKDPDVVGIDVNPMDVRVGTLRPEDTEDYHRWKTEKETRATRDPSQPTGWLSGFSYIKDALLRDIEVVRKRYLPSIFGETEVEDGSTGKRSGKRTHDEA